MPKFREVTQAAMEIADVTERRKMLDGACNGDLELRARVEKFLAAEGAADNFFSDCATAIVESKDEAGYFAGLKDDPSLPGGADIGDPLGSKIGPYKLLQKIGEGGCGVVYMAEQEKPVRRRVALKIIKVGMDTKSVIARFEAERQALALMDHPNISRVLDAGATEAGRPYFVMELVHGVRITEYCDTNRLETSQRLKLLIQVCQAIQHAHQKGVIHRDIKPSNILVTTLDGVPVPKVIDFGIAKAIEEKLTDKTLFTMYGHFIGTPAYMSPEQAQMSGMDVDTRSDIYSLGVLLYELLTGKTPFDQQELVASGIDAMRRTLSDREPHRPSTKLDVLTPTELTMTADRRHVEPSKLRLDLQGDLDWIVMKALEKDRSRRYQTANGLAMDVQRYLDNEPILARPPSRLYRLQKLVRRNKIVFIASAAVVTALVGGIGLATVSWLKERDARQRMVLAEQQKTALQQEAARLESLRQTSEERRKFAEATTFFQKNQLDKADDLLDEIPKYQAGLDAAIMYRQIGDWDAKQGHWAKALNRFGILSVINQATNSQVDLEISLDDMRIGALLADQGELSEYEQFRKVVAGRYADTTNTITAERALRSCLLTKADKAMLQSLAHCEALTVESIESNPNKQAGDTLAWHSYSLALMAYRSGDYRSATNWCGRALKYDRGTLCRDLGVQLIRAMALAQLGNMGEARAELTASRGAVENEASRFYGNVSRWQGFWFDWAVARVLLREASSLIENDYDATH